MSKQFLISTPEELEEVANFLLIEIKNGGIVALTGELGAGKTTLTQIIGKKLGVNQPLTSPTFSIMNIYELPDRQLYHLDLYRLKTEQEVEHIGFTEVVEELGNIVIIEWPELAKRFLPGNTIGVTIDILEDGRRKITVE